MHEGTRRQLCRLLFVVLCLAPTAWVCGLVGFRHSSLGAAARRTAWETAVFDRLGIEARIERAVEVAPGITVLEGVELWDPDGDRRLAIVRLLEVFHSDELLALRASQPLVEPGQLDRLAEVLHDRVLRGPPLPHDCEIYVTELTLAGGKHAHTLTHVRCTFPTNDSGPSALIEFQVAGVDMTAPAELHVVRNRQTSPPVTGWRLRTGSKPLPCSLLAEYVTPLQQIGPDATFVGSLWIERSDDGWNGELSGTLDGVGLSELLKPFPHKLSGQAEVELKRVRLRDGKLEEIAGKIQSPGGVISHSLITGLQQAFNLPPADDAADADARLLKYEQLAFAFELDRAGLRVVGACEGHENALVATSDRVLLGQPANEVLPAVALTRALVPNGDLQVPASRQTDLLLRTLPLPDSLAPARTAGQGYAPLRLRN